MHFIHGMFIDKVIYGTDRDYHDYSNARENIYTIQVWTQKCAVQKASVDVNISYY